MQCCYTGKFNITIFSYRKLGLIFANFLFQNEVIFRHESGSKIRLRECDYKLIDDDGNVILVLAEVSETHHYSCSIVNEIAENSTGAPDKPFSVVSYYTGTVLFRSGAVLS